MPPASGPGFPWPQGQPNPGFQFQQPPFQAEPPNPRKRRLWLKVGLPLFLVVVLAGGFAVVYHGVSEDRARSAGERDLGSGSATDPYKYFVNVPAGDTKQYPADVPGYMPSATPSAEQLATADPRQLYWAVLKRQGMAVITEVTKVGGYMTTQDYEADWPGGLVSHSVIDWRSRKFIQEDTSVKADGSPDTSTVRRCLDSNTVGTYSQADPIVGKPAGWETAPDSMHACDDKLKPNQDVANVIDGDGVAPAGLSSSDMDKFISYLDHVPGLIHVEKPIVATGKDGKQYIQLKVSLTPQDSKLQSNDFRMGQAFLNAAFVQTGKNPSTWPFIISGNVGQGKRMAYYIDPQTLLPAYSVFMDTKVLNVDGTPDLQAPQPQWRQLYEYGFPQQLDSSRLQASGTPDNAAYKAPPFDRPDFN